MDDERSRELKHWEGKLARIDRERKGARQTCAALVREAMGYADKESLAGRDPRVGYDPTLGMNPDDSNQPMLLGGTKVTLAAAETQGSFPIYSPSPRRRPMRA